MAALAKALRKSPGIFFRRAKAKLLSPLQRSLVPPLPSAIKALLKVEAPWDPKFAEEQTSRPPAGEIPPPTDKEIKK